MALTKKTTILFPEDLHEHLARLARRQQVSLGYLVRNACRSQYGLVSRRDRLEAVDALNQMSLPVGDVDEMMEQSVPKAEDLLP